MFRDREKARLSPLKTQLFSPHSCTPGTYRRKAYDFCLHDACSMENLHESLRLEALAYFRTRRIPWHDGLCGGGLPSNHLCCSQSACVNAWFPFRDSPDPLRDALRALGFPVARMMAYHADRPGALTRSYVAFEWIGARNYLCERDRGKVATDAGRSRGKGFTSADFAFRFRRTDGRIQIVLGEWKYTEEYKGKGCMRYSDRGTDRLAIYTPFLQSPQSPIRRPRTGWDSLFYDPFDQLMRLQLLAREMERCHEMRADLVTVMHVAPRSNDDLALHIPEGLRDYGRTVHEVWSALVGSKRFQGVATEDLLLALCAHAPDPAWADYVRRRYAM